LLLEKEGEDEERLFVFVSAIEEEETTKDKTQRGTVTSAGMHAQIRPTPWRGREISVWRGALLGEKFFCMRPIGCLRRETRGAGKRLIIF
jgi:hypothetical protein